MPVILRPTMTDEEILTHIAQTYADPSNWESYEKDYGVYPGAVERDPFAFRDRGDYARLGLSMIAERRKVRDFNTMDFDGGIDGSL